MKKILTIMLMMTAVICCNAQTKKSDTQKFLNRYAALIKRMDAKYADNTDSLYAWKAERKKIRTLYTEKYKDLFSDDEIEEYSSLNTQYTSKSTEYKLEKLGVKVDSIGAKVTRSAQKTGKKVSGIIKGLKKQSDANRSK